MTEQLPEYQSEMERNKLNLQTVLFRPLRSHQCSSEWFENWDMSTAQRAINTHIYIYTIEQCTLPVTTIMALWQFVNLGTRCTVTHCRLHCGVTRVLKLRAVSDA